jgi:hypothetical protein
MWVSQGGTGRIAANCTVQGMREGVSEGNVDVVNSWLQVCGLGESRVMLLRKKTRDLLEERGEGVGKGGVVEGLWGRKRSRTALAGSCGMSVCGQFAGMEELTRGEREHVNLIRR